MISENTKFYDIYDMPNFSQCRDYFFANARHSRYFKTKNMLISEINKVKPHWDPDDIVYGLNRLLQISNSNFFYDVYSKDNLDKFGEKKDVKLFYFPSSVKSKKFAIVCSGGAYVGTCNVVEGFPISAKLNELGYNAFVLCYTVNQQALMPKPLDDIYTSYNFITNNFNVNKNDYILVGSSAGANLVTIFGTSKFGYKKYNLPKPKLILCEYPFVSFSLKPCLFRSGIEDIMFGKNANINLYDIENNIDFDYPTTYAVACKDDEDVNPENIILLDKQLTQNKIKHKCLLAENGGHGFGLGSKTDCNGWIEKGLTLI